MGIVIRYHLKGERAARCEDGAKEPDQKGEKDAHGIVILPQPEVASILRRIWFSRRTGIASPIRDG